jgi:hypothetical protein
MGKLQFHGRRILKWETGQGTVFTKSGQWVGHAYGNEWGTKRQRDNAAPSYDSKLIGISSKVFWNMNGYAGEEVQPIKGLEFVTP